MHNCNFSHQYYSSQILPDDQGQLVDDSQQVWPVLYWVGQEGEVDQIGTQHDWGLGVAYNHCNFLTPDDLHKLNNSISICIMEGTSQAHYDLLWNIRRQNQCIG